MPIGGVLATKDVIIPNAVGVDIGCGMCAVKTDIQDFSKKQLRDLRALIYDKVPVGFKHHKKKQNERYMPLGENDLEIVGDQYEKALYQIGTLGGGNHFIEIQKDEAGFLWIMIHSGSRNLGKTVADHYNKLAQNENKSSGNEYVKDLAYLDLNSETGQKYFHEMNYCVNFAFANRKLMLERVQESILKIFKKADFGEIINIAHNYAASENHYDNDVIVHRKGATSARKGEIGIIPGSQGTSSYIVEGLGNPESFNSCSHGAGRVKGRRQAKRELDLGQQIDLMGDVIHGIKSVDDLDEAVGAYKNIDEVMQNQKDLVKILVKLKPLMVVKG